MAHISNLKLRSLSADILKVFCSNESTSTKSKIIYVNVVSTSNVEQSIALWPSTKKGKVLVVKKSSIKITVVKMLFSFL